MPKPPRSRIQTSTCAICGQKKTGMVPAALVRPFILLEIQKSHPEFTVENNICLEDLNRFRTNYIQSLLASEKGELTDLENDVVDSLHQHELLSSNINLEFESKLSFGEAMADKLAGFGGSWRFILMFGAVLLTWILVNSAVLIRNPFDPYPYILLNLVLSCLAALQAPVIMMSQNRLEAKDRLRSENDYQINLKAELEIRHLHEKIDHLLLRQWERLVEIQQVQIELLSELSAYSGRNR